MRSVYVVLAVSCFGETLGITLAENKLHIRYTRIHILDRGCSTWISHRHCELENVFVEVVLPGNGVPQYKSVF